MTKSELKSHLERTIDIILIAKQHLFDSKNLLLHDTSEKDIIIRRNKFMSRIQEALWILSIIETSKLYGKGDDDFTLQKLINYMRNNNYRNSEWKEDISLEEINCLEEEKLLDSRVKNIVANLQELRDRHYAHKQKAPPRNETDIDLYYNNVEFLLTNAENFCQSINKKVFANRISVRKIDEISVHQTINNLVDFVRLKGLESFR